MPQIGWWSGLKSDVTRGETWISLRVPVLRTLAMINGVEVLPFFMNMLSIVWHKKHLSKPSLRLVTRTLIGEDLSKFLMRHTWDGVARMYNGRGECKFCLRRRSGQLYRVVRRHSLEKRSCSEYFYIAGEHYDSLVLYKMTLLRYCNTSGTWLLFSRLSFWRILCADSTYT